VLGALNREQPLAHISFLRLCKEKCCKRRGISGNFGGLVRISDRWGRSG
jgi:hypothetical protein